MAISSVSPAAWTAAAVVLVLGLLLRGALGRPAIRRHGALLRTPPGTLPLVGNGILFLQARQKLFSWFVKCERLFGRETFAISVPTLPPGVVINDPRNLEYVFKNEGVFSKGDFVKRRSWDLFGHGIINADGDLWKAQRKAGLNFLNTSNLRVLTDNALPRYLLESFRVLEAKADGRTAVDLQAVFHEITSQIMGKMAYNMEIHADDEFSLAFDFASGATAERFQNPLWAVTEIFGSKLRRSIAVVKAFGDEVVNNALSRHRQAGEPGSAGPGTGQRIGGDDDDSRLEEVSGSLIQSLLSSISDKQMVADAALNYLSAGRDTTAQALTWTFYLLMRNKAEAAKIRDEVQQLLHHHAKDTEDDYDAGRPAAAATTTGGGSTTTTTTTRRPIPLSLFTPSALPRTTAAFYESLRLYPPVPFEIKQCDRPATLPDGTSLPTGSVVVWCPWAMNRSRLTWGPDADDFRPDRWLATPGPPPPSPPAAAAQGAVNEGYNGGNGGGGKPPPPPLLLTARSASEFPVFNGGPRTCLGKRMAELTAVQVIAAALWTFEFELEPPAAGDGDGERVSRSSLTLPMDGGLPCFVRLRSDALEI